MADNIFLLAAEGGVAEDFTQDVGGIFQRGGSEHGRNESLVAQLIAEAGGDPNWDF